MSIPITIYEKIAPDQIMMHQEIEVVIKNVGGETYLVYMINNGIRS